MSLPFKKKQKRGIYTIAKLYWEMICNKKIVEAAYELPKITLINIKKHSYCFDIHSM